MYSFNNIKAVIFDLDGTLVNTISDLAKSVDYALAKFGFSGHTLAEYTSYVGNGTLKLIERSLPQNVRDDKALLGDVHNTFSAYYAEHFCDSSTAYDGISDLLDYLQNRGVALCVNSNKPDRFTKAIIEKFFPNYEFAVCIGARDNVPKKPNPASELEIAEILGLDKAQILHIGDSDVDILTAHNSGIKAIGCSWGFRSKESLIQAGADYMADSPAEIKEFFKKGCNL